jgi:hypothetical protein
LVLNTFSFLIIFPISVLRQTPVNKSFSGSLSIEFIFFCTDAAWNRQVRVAVGNAKTRRNNVLTCFGFLQLCPVYFDVFVFYFGIKLICQKKSWTQTWHQHLSTKPLKSLNWAKIPPMKVQETIWKELDDSKIHKVLKGVSYLEFEDLFAAREMKDISSVDAVIAPVVSKEVTFLDSKRAQGINIMLKAIKLDPKAIKKAIVTVDTDTLPRFVLVELLKLVPTEDELATLKQYGDPKNLATAERFMYEISEIEIYEAKLKGMFFKVSFPELEDDAETMLNALGKSAREVMDSEKLKEILRVRLMI